MLDQGVGCGIAAQFSGRVVEHAETFGKLDGGARRHDVTFAARQIGGIGVLGVAVVEGAQHEAIDRRAEPAGPFLVAQHDRRRDHRLEAQIGKSFRLGRRGEDRGQRVRHRIGRPQAVAAEIDGAGADSIAAAEAQRRKAGADDGEFGRHLERRGRRILRIEILVVRIVRRHGLGGIGISGEVLAGWRHAEAPSSPARNRFLEIEIA